MCDSVAKGKPAGEFPLTASVPGGEIGKATVIVKNLEWTALPTFSDYLRDGYQVSLVGAVDFTYSNGL